MKRLLFSITALLAALSLRAGPVAQHEALRRAVLFLEARGRCGEAPLPVTFVARQPRRLTPAATALPSGGSDTVTAATTLTADTTTDASSAYYVFNIEADGGFVIVSGDDATPPILGYADRGAFRPDSLPPAMEAWLRDCEEHLDHLRDCPSTVLAFPFSNSTVSSASSTATAVSVRSSIAPMLTTEWDQSDPYNRQVLDAGKYRNICYTGCVATALAQLLTYHARLTGRPRATTADIPDYVTKTYHYEVDGVSAGTAFDWNVLLDRYTPNATAINKAQQRTLDAVAQLMHICGAAVSMDYSTTNSGANSWIVPDVLKSVFGYDRATRMADRYDYTISQWNELIYNELAARRPVYFTGASSGGGHAFIVDGYDGDEHFHINWGWGGHCNGYYLLSLANPTDKEGIGAGTSDDGYTMRQGALIGAQPDTKLEPTDTLHPQRPSGQVRLAVTDVGFEQTLRAGRTLKANAKLVNLADEFYGNVHFITKKIGLIFRDTCSVGVALTHGQEQTLPFTFRPETGGQYAVSIATDIDSLGVLFADTIDVLPPSAKSKDVALDITMELLNLDGNGQGILGNKARLRTTVTNPTATAYEGVFVPIMASASGANINAKRAYFEAYSTTVIEREFDVLTGMSYLPICITEIPGRQQVYQSPRRYYPVLPAVGIYRADGSYLAYEARAYAAVPADAVAVSLVGNATTTSVTPSANPNCIYYLSEGADIPAGLTTNIVSGTHTALLTLTDGHPFLPAYDFNAADIAYTRHFDSGTTAVINGRDTLFTPSWTTLCLPFSADHCQLSDGRTVAMPTDVTDADFWLMEYQGDEGDTLFFTPARSMRAYTPYLICVPAAGMEPRPDMTATAVTFFGHNAVIRAKASSVTASEHYKFTGVMHAVSDADNTYAIDADGRHCHRQKVLAEPFRAYFKATGPNTATAETLTLSIASEIMRGADAPIRGDVNADGHVDVADISTVINVMTGACEAESDKQDTMLRAADVNADGMVDVADISAIIIIMTQ